MRDIKNNLDVAGSITPTAYTASVNGIGVDLQNFDAAMIVFHVDSITDGTHTPKMQESDDNSTYTDVAAVDMEGVLVALVTGVIQRTGYRGNKRYIRAVSTVTGTTVGGVYGATIVRGVPQAAPVA